MKQTLYSYKNDGFWDGLNDYQIDLDDVNAKVPEGYTAVAPSGFYKAKWSVDHWEEGATADEIKHWFDKDDSPTEITTPAEKEQQTAVSYSNLLEMNAQTQQQVVALSSQVAVLSAAVAALAGTATPAKTDTTTKNK